MLNVHFVQMVFAIFAKPHTCQQLHSSSCGFTRNSRWWLVTGVKVRFFSEVSQACFRVREGSRVPHGSCARFQTSGVGALLCLVNDDDPRQPDCIPSAVETRDRAITDKVFPKVRKALENALDVEERQGPFPRLREKVVLALSVVACRESTVHEMVFEGNMLSRIETSVSDVDERVVRACLALIRAFGFADEIKETTWVSCVQYYYCFLRFRLQHYLCYCRKARAFIEYDV